jgi:hypothetical protein
VLPRSCLAEKDVNTERMEGNVDIKVLPLELSRTPTSEQFIFLVETTDGPTYVVDFDDDTPPDPTWVVPTE